MSMGYNRIDINSATRQKSLRSLKKNPKIIKYKSRTYQKQFIIDNSYKQLLMETDEEQES